MAEDVDAAILRTLYEIRDGMKVTSAQVDWIERKLESLTARMVEVGRVAAIPPGRMTLRWSDREPRV